MKKLSDIKKTIKIIEESILGDKYLEVEFNKTANTRELIQARKVLLWVIQSQPRKEKDVNNTKLEDYKIESPIK